MNFLLRITFFALLLTAAHAADWQTVQVPAARKIEGVAWYRAWFMPNKNFFIKHERDLVSRVGEHHGARAGGGA